MIDCMTGLIDGSESSSACTVLELHVRDEYYNFEMQKKTQRTDM
jgi:hypothetical protein